MHSVWIVHHVKPETDVYLEDVKLIGIYRTRSDGEAAIARLRSQPGFREWPDEFTCGEYKLNQDHWTSGFIVEDADVPSESTV